MVLHLLRGELIDQRAMLRRLAALKCRPNEIELSRGAYRVGNSGDSLSNSESRTGEVNRCRHAERE